MGALSRDYGTYSSGQKKSSRYISFYDCRMVDCALIVGTINDPLTLMQLAHSCVKIINFRFKKLVRKTIGMLKNANKAVLEKEEQSENVKNVNKTMSERKGKSENDSEDSYGESPEEADHLVFTQYCCKQLECHWLAS